MNELQLMRNKLYSGTCLALSMLHTKFVCCFLLLSLPTTKPTSTPPMITNKSPSLTYVNEGDTVELFCEAEGVPQPSHIWLKDGFQIFQSDRVQTTVEGAKKNVVRLLIQRFQQQSDSSVYSCHFWNFVGNVSHHMKILVAERHWIISDNVFILASPRNVTLLEGGRAKLTCQAEGFPLNVTYRWFFNGVNVLAMASLKQRIQIFHDGSLVINNLDKKDAGWYKCSPTNNLGNAPEAESYVNVTYMPRVINMPSKVYLANNMQGKLSCSVDANPPVTLIRWHKDSRPIDFSTNKHIQLSSDGRHLTMLPASRRDEGEYYCVPYSSFGQGEKSLTIQVKVRDPPYFDQRPRPIYQRQPTQSVTMACQAVGDPPPTITWRKADGDFAAPSKLLHSGGNLTVVNLSKEDHGYYECVASNQVADVVASTLVIVELTTPHGPRNVTAVPSKDNVHLSWLPAYDGGFPLHYLVWYTSSDEMEDWKTMRVPYPNLTSVIIYQLKKNTVYHFMVLSRSRLGVGLFSKLVQVKTLGSPKDGCPTENCHTTVTPSSQALTSNQPDLYRYEGLKPPKPINLTAKYFKSHLNISWSIPSFAESNDIYLPIHHFSLQYRTVGQWVPLVDRLLATTSYNWTTVSRGVTYQFRVSAYSKLPMESKFVPGEYSDVFIFHTGDPMHYDSLVTDQTIGAIIGLFFVSGILVFLLLVFLRKLCSKVSREKSRKGTESNNHVFPANTSDHECSSTIPETESLCKPLSKIKETPI